MSKNIPNKKEKEKHGLGGLWRDGQDFPIITRPEKVLHHTRQAWQSFVSAPITSILTAITISTALLVFSIFILLIENIKGVVASASTELSVSLYMKDEVMGQAMEDLKKEISALPDVESVSYVSKAQALEDFRKTLGERALLLEGMEQNNPLPVSLEIKFRKRPGIEEYFPIFAENYSKKEGVEHVEYSRNLVDRLSGFLRFFGWIGSLSIVFMLLITSFIITNTIRLALYSHREEIEIMALVGATNNFVRAPYMIEGFFQGLVGGIFAILLSYGCYVLLQDLLNTNELIKLLLPSLAFLSFKSILLIILAGIAVGVIGSFLAVRRFINNSAD